MWYNKYVGIPYKFGGADFTGADCWGLACLVHDMEFGNKLNRYQTTEETPAELAGLITSKAQDAQAVDQHRVGDIIVITIAGQPCHVGIVIGGGLMLHSLKGHDSAVESYRAKKWATRIEGVYRVS